MKHAWEIMGSAIEEAWDQFGPLTIIWLPTMLVVLVVYLICMAPFYANMIQQITQYGVYSTGSWFNFVSTLLGLLSLLAICGVMVNSWRYLVNNSFEPSWMPFRFDWRTTFAVFGYCLLLLLVFLVFVVIAGFIFGLGASGMANVFMTTSTSIGQRFTAGLGYFGVVIAIIGVFYGVIYVFRASMILVARSLGDKPKFGDIIRATHPHQMLFVMMALIFFAITIGIVTVAYLAIALAVTLPVALLFFLPPYIGLFFGVILGAMVYIMMMLFLSFIKLTAMAEIYRRVLMK